MGSIEVLKKYFFLVLLLSLFSFFPLFGQNGVTTSLTAEISRLEKTALDAAGAASRERYNAFLDLIRLRLLAGNAEAALKACEDGLALFPGDSRLLLEQAKLLISQGAYDKAGEAINNLFKNEKDPGLLNQGRYLAAQLAAFHSGSTQALVELADDPDFAGYRAGIYYTLWKLTALPAWKTKLSAEFPQSPEAKIAAAGADSAVIPAPTPLWLLFSGRNSIVLSAPAALPAAQTPAPAPVPAAQPVSAQDQSSGFLQTGLFGREGNARAMGENLKKAGFEPRILRRAVNGNDYWSVSVSAGRDMNATLLKLKDAGFEAFPVSY